MTWIIGLMAGLLTGVLSGFGIGGGSLLILYLTMFTGMEQYAAGGVNLLYFIFCAPAALISHIKNRLIEWKTVLLCTLTGVVTSIGAALLASVMEVSLLRRLFGILLVYIGIKELFCKKEPTEKEGKDENTAANISSK